MKITHNKVGQNLNLTDSSKADKAKGPKGAKSADLKFALDVKEFDPGASKVELSTRAQDMKRIKELADATPDVDEAKVAKYQKLIDAGNYKVDAEAVADKMVDDHMLFS
jgi:negative regulator of flagellin synthesis FlgM